ncbi:DUF2147 domain-containing protein [Nioella nitratireducens]|uniref:DUF2147 domain-containing protein n=1 Tax=Nioella nitratireducens TaxID=1287720 RepID=UPI0008FD30A1|nr:DUF2147 domain-containing protein [Nioella nitratireducens]
MKAVIFGLVAAIGLAGMASADPIEGRWRTAPDDNGNTGLIDVVPCGDAYCGTLIEAYDPSGSEMSSPNVGRQIIFDMRPRGSGAYRGRVYSPDRDQTYNSRVQIDGNSLAVRGCVLGICRDGGTWSRVN